ncbi:MAG: hypothetical protein AB1416_08225, partial [Actinomycetota bacterium]
MGLVIGRIAIDDPEAWSEPAGNEVGMVGGVPVPAPRTGLKVTPVLSTWPAGEGGTAADRARIRRQLRALLQNPLVRARGVYVAWSEDPEQDGWYMPGAAVFETYTPDLSQQLYRVTGLELSLIGRARTHRRAVVARVADRRLATTPRDTLGRVTSTDFAGLSALAVVALPSGASDVVVHGAAAPLTVTVAEAGYGGASLQRVIGAMDLTVVSVEQADAHRLLGDVVVLDRRGGTTTMLSTGPQAVWEEVYGPDQPLTAGDVPVLENGLCRVSYDTGNVDGFRVDVWTGSAWAEQGKAVIARHNGSLFALDTLVSARVVEWTAERAVVCVVMRAAADATSREEVFLTLQRGWLGPRIEVYPARTAGGAAGAAIDWTLQ